MGKTIMKINEAELITYLEKLYVAAFNLRKAQKAYMENRGNEEMGQAVGKAAKELDLILDLVTLD